MADVEAEELRRTNPEMYRARRDEGYIRGIREDRPAVISVNMFFASLVVQEFLARLHPFRNQPNTAYAAVRANLLEPFIITEPDGAYSGACGYRFRGDVDKDSGRMWIRIPGMWIKIPGDVNTPNRDERGGWNRG